LEENKRSSRRGEERNQRRLQRKGKGRRERPTGRGKKGRGGEEVRAEGISRGDERRGVIRGGEGRDEDRASEDIVGEPSRR